MSYNPNIHHRRSIRLKGYDYSQEGLYFITICVHNRACLFGEITNVKMMLNDTGKIAGDYWFNIPEHFPHAVLHEFVVMPNHIHGIIEIVGLRNETVPATTDTPGDPVGTCHGMSPPPTTPQFGKPIPGSISVIINQYKSSVKRWCNKNGHSRFQWQSRFHDHIIRDEQSYQRISEYILKNPANWKDDKFYI